VLTGNRGKKKQIKREAEGVKQRREGKREPVEYDQ
jgi:hypothetical protein